MTDRGRERKNKKRREKGKGGDRAVSHIRR